MCQCRLLLLHCSRNCGCSQWGFASCLLCCSPRFTTEDHTHWVNRPFQQRYCTVKGGNCWNRFIFFNSFWQKVSHSDKFVGLECVAVWRNDTRRYSKEVKENADKCYTQWALPFCPSDSKTTSGKKILLKVAHLSIDSLNWLMDTEQLVMMLCSPPCGFAHAKLLKPHRKPTAQRMANFNRNGTE